MYKFVLMFCLMATSVCAEDKFVMEKAEDIALNVVGMIGGGSGIALKIDGRPYVLTAEHVTQTMVQITVNDEPVINPLMCIVNANKNALGKIIHTNEQLDLALLEIPKAISTHFAILADKRPEKGTIVHHMGVFHGLDGEDSYSSGHVSKSNRKFQDIQSIQVTCAVMSGSSGGPIFGDDMKCYGMALAMSSDGRIGFCVSSVDINKWLKTLKLEHKNEDR